jgi:hypothetical protein
MKMTKPACGIAMSLLTAVSPVVGADPAMQSALANCREEAVSTGLQEQADIQAYINLCMQAWQTPDGYAPADSMPATNPEEEAAEALPADNPEDTAPSQ